MESILSMYLIFHSSFSFFYILLLLYFISFIFYFCYILFIYICLFLLTNIILGGTIQMK